MDNHIKVLFLEDRMEDAELGIFELENAGYDVSWKRVEKKEEFFQALKEFAPDLILSDYNLPDFNGSEALAFSLKEYPEIPFIFVTGAMGEDKAVEFIKQGAADYILKQKLFRLASSVRRSLNDVLELKKRKELEEKLKESEERSRNTLDRMMEGCQIIGFDYRYIYVNDAVAAQGHKTREELLGHTMMEIYPGIENTEMFSWIKHCMEERAPHRTNNEFSYPDGRKGWFDLSIQPISEGVFILSIDITEKIIAEENLKDNEILYRRLFEKTPAGIAIGDPKGHVMNVNKAMLDIFGYTESEFTNMEIPYFFANHAEYETALKLLYENNEINNIEFKMKHKNGSFFPALISGNIFERNGLKLAQVVISDISRLKQAEFELKTINNELEQRVKIRTMKLKNIQERYRMLFQQGNDAIMVMELSEEGLPENFSEVNDVACKMLGYTREEMLKLLPEKIIKPEEMQSIRNEYKAIGEIIRKTVNSKFVTKDDKIIPVEISIHVFEYNGKKMSLNIVRDISEKIKADAALHENEANYWLLAKIALLSNETLNKESFLEAVIKAVTAHIGWQIGHIYLTEKQENGEIILNPSKIWYLEDPDAFREFVSVTETVTFKPGEGLVGETYEGDLPVLVKYLETDHAYLRKDSALKTGIKIAAALPIIIKSGTVGVLEFYSTQETQPVEKVTSILNMIIYPLKTAMERLNSEEKSEKLSKAIQQNPSGIVIMNRNSIIEYVNQRYMELTGFEPEDIIGKHAEVLGYDINPDIILEINKTVNRGEIWKGELLNKRKDRTQYWESLLISPVKNENNEIIYIVTTINDITNLKKIGADLLLAKEEAERANSTKSDFLAKMSHEIRTPLNAIIGLSNLALKTEMSAKQRDYLEKISNSSLLLLDLINDILDFSKIEAGKVEIEHIEFDLEQVLKDIWTMIAIKAEEKKLEIILNEPEQIPSRLIGDPLHLCQILLNLMNNAIKFTEKGEITLSIEMVNREDHQLTYLFKLKDTGIGMDRDQVAKLYKPFVQGESSITRKYGGTGLGLTITRKLVKLMGGFITVVSEKGKGSEFIFTLTFGLNKEKPDLRMGLSSFAKFNFLIVDDNEEARLNMKHIFESFGVKAGSVSSGNEAEMLLKDPDIYYDLVFIDFEMPGMNGVETSKTLKGYENLKDLNIILMGYENEINNAYKDIKEYFANYMIKPVTPSNLFNLLIEHFGGNAKEAVPFKIVVEEEYRKENLEGSYILLAEDNEINQQVAVELLQSAGIKTDVACNGREALDLLKKNSYDAVLMDIQMPEMDGITATKIIRKDPALKNTVIIAMTADVISSRIKEYNEAGMNDSVFKPIDENQFFDTLTRWIKPVNREKGKFDSGPIPETDDEIIDIPELPGLDTRTGISRVMGNKKIYRRILFKFSENEKDWGSNILDALGKGRIDEVKKLVHSLKGVSGNIGAIGLYRSLIEAEDLLKTGSMEAAKEQIKEASDIHIALIHAIGGWKNSLRTSIKTVFPADGEPDKEQAGRIFEELLDYLEHYDTESSKAFERLQESTGPYSADISRELEKAGKQIEDYNFDNARLTILDIAGKIGVKINRNKELSV